eukprot:TRINITY_DN7706_c0_g1_i2.p1 TRINITY_DN7706_c0_g1~~TRINITY_DN7706_c0_g1_i2.p1  ORF type:complete len:351 (-),score=70.20 TRINITY_DN7706_c0_g1_i2:41-1093(-)
MRLNTFLILVCIAVIVSFVMVWHMRQPEDPARLLRTLDDAKDRLEQFQQDLSAMQKQIKSLSDSIKDATEEKRLGASLNQQMENDECNTRCKKAILTYYCFDAQCKSTPEFVRRSVENKKRYTEYWGYDMIVEGIDSVDRVRKSVWGKINALRAHLQDYEWIMWVDTDTMIMNPRISLDEILSDSLKTEAEWKDVNLIISKDWNGINAGVFLIRNSSWSYAVLDEVYERYDAIQTDFQEQSAIQFVLKESEAKNYKIVPQRKINSFPEDTTPGLLTFGHSEESAYHAGDFLIHFAGCRDQLRRDCEWEIARWEKKAITYPTQRHHRRCKPSYRDYHVKHYPHGHSHLAEY